MTNDMTDSKNNLKRYAACVEYLGGRYFGWQRLSHGPSVQAEVEKALSKVANSPVEVTCAGRTDSGVHGLGQVVHFDTEAIRPEYGWMRGANVHLPDDISISWVKEVDDSFHARYSAAWRRYCYVIHVRPSRSGLLNGRVCHWHKPLDVEPMQKAAQFLLGEHDFTSFRAAGCQANTPNRCLTFIDVRAHNSSKDVITVEVVGNAFLHHMVRNIVGTLLEIGMGNQPIEWTKQLLEIKDRTQAGVTAPAEGLYFMEVGYPEFPDLPRFSGLPPAI